MNIKQFSSISAITRQIQETLQPIIGIPIWVKGEISSGRERGGSFYCNLIESDPRGNIIAEIRCTIWKRNLDNITQQFRAHNLDLKLDNGTTVGFLCSVQYHQRYGLSLNVTDADPVFALGELELRKRQIIEKMASEDLLDRNKAIPVPVLPQRIGLITSSGSAAYNDFIKTLTSSRFGFKVQFADAKVQGDETESTIIHALDVLEGRNIDLMVIIRGGGSKTELSSLDNEAIARRIASYTLPVWTGIGHEIDISVLDYVVNRYFRTPTAVAEELLDMHYEMDRHLQESQARFQLGVDRLINEASSKLRDNANSLLRDVERRLSTERNAISLSTQSLTRGSVSLVAMAKNNLDDLHQECVTRFNRYLRFKQNQVAGYMKRFYADRFFKRIRNEKARIESLNTSLMAYDPVTSLRRGFSLVYDQSGKLVKSINDIAIDKTINTKVTDGYIVSTVRETRRKKDDE